jgi:hypothetical protein
MGERDVSVSPIPKATKEKVSRCALTYSFVNCLRTLGGKDNKRICIIIIIIIIIIIVNSPVTIIKNLFILDGGNLLKVSNLLSP